MADIMGFSTDIIQEACRRTISATHQPSFEYADSFWAVWYECNIHHLTDINALDHEFQKERSYIEVLPQNQRMSQEI